MPKSCSITCGGEGVGLIPKLSLQPGGRGGSSCGSVGGEDVSRMPKSSFLTLTGGGEGVGLIPKLSLQPGGWGVSRMPKSCFLIGDGADGEGVAGMLISRFRSEDWCSAFCGSGDGDFVSRMPKSSFGNGDSGGILAMGQASACESALAGQLHIGRLWFSRRLCSR